MNIKVLEFFGVCYIFLLFMLILMITEHCSKSPYCPSMISYLLFIQHSVFLYFFLILSNRIAI